MRRSALVVAAALAASPALAAETGCDKLAWPIERERALLAKATPAGDAEHPLGAAIVLRLAPQSSAKLATAPERAPKLPAPFAGVARFSAAPKPGAYQVTLLHDGWVDLVQDDARLKSVAFTGVPDCPGVRKSVRFEIGARPFVVQVSDAKADAVAIVVTPVD